MELFHHRSDVVDPHVEGEQIETNRAIRKAAAPLVEQEEAREGGELLQESSL